MTTSGATIGDVSDTSIWVAYYRAQESERPDALFSDPFAKVLVGERGKKIADHMKQLGSYTSWTVTMRTLIIDEYIQKLVQEGVDTVINLGAGLDTRPYRMQLPSHLKWIEVDYPHVNQHKNKVLSGEEPHCELTRVNLDLANDEKRKSFLYEIGQKTKKAVVLTEGVIPYLKEKQVASLAHELYEQPSLHYWITEYIHPDAYPYMKNKLRARKMRNAPFEFFPLDWFGFFKSKGWLPKEVRYHGEESLKRGRPIPMPWWATFFKIFASRIVREKSKRFSGYILFEKSLF